jgi:CheY-like chemotaxis protein
MRIVLVDPSRAVQRAMTQLMEEGGHDVVVFADGLEALSFIARDCDVRTLITSLSHSIRPRPNCRDRHLRNHRRP